MEESPFPLRLVPLTFFALLPIGPLCEIRVFFFFFFFVFFFFCLFFLFLFFVIVFFCVFISFFFVFFRVLSSVFFFFFVREVLPHPIPVGVSPANMSVSEVRIFSPGFTLFFFLV